MARQIIPINRFSGISDSEKEGLTSSFLWAQNCDYRTDPSKLTILPRTTKNSGSIVTGLILDGDRVGTNHYFYDDVGNIYKKTSGDVWTNEHTVSNSHGNGMVYFKEDDYLYYTNDIAIGRYGRISGTPAWSDDFLGAQGGIPLNLASMNLVAASSMYATAADSVSLSITGDITLEGYFKPASLPTAGSSMTLISKWNGSSDERSYVFDLYAASGYFGDGSDGALTVSTNTTQSPIDSACTGTAASYSLTATNVSFATGQKILIHQTKGTGAGKWERNEIASYTAGTITLSNALTNTYTSGAQVIVLLEYTNVTVNSGVTWTAKAWNGTVGGILAFLANGTITVTGTITATGKGFRGGASYEGGHSTAYQGEGISGTGSQSTAANGQGGGGGTPGVGSGYGGGGGGGNAANGETGTFNGSGTPGTGGGTAGSADLTTLLPGGGGGGGGVDNAGPAGDGGPGGGIIFAIGTDLVVTGSITANGSVGENQPAPGGSGAGGSILLKAQTATLGTALITATGGARNTYGSGYGGAGGTGRIHLDYYTSYTGTTSPTLDYAQDSGLVTNTTYQLRFGVSTDGTSTTQEVLTKSLSATPSTGNWYHWSVNWDASGAQAEFFANAVSQGTAVGAKTSIYDSTALFAIGAKFDASGNPETFFNGKFDDVRVWNDIRTSTELYNNKDVELTGSEANLQGYWQVDSAATDTTANANNLTLVNTPTYDTADVPFSSPTTRQDLDQSLDTSGQTTITATSASEAATAKQSFVPTKDPQKSIEINISDTGDDPDWTITVHDAQNRVIATKTLAFAEVHTGDNEFTFSTPWRPVLGQTYHFHVTTSTVTGAPAVVSTSSNDLETVDFHSYYQFLVEDDNHPIQKFLDFIAIGNERYLSKWDGITYTPHALTFPSNYHVRCLGFWREYLAIGITVGDTITDYEYGMLFFWDGVSDTYNFYRYVPEGAINSILSGDPMYFMAGYAGDLMKFDGGNPYKIRRMPNVKNSDVIEIHRKALTMWRALLHLGFSGTSTSTIIKRGVYSYGTLNQRLPETLSFDYTLSTGIIQDANTEIGMVFASGTNLYIAWKNGSSYGMDVVKPSNPCFATATYESLITDDNKIFGEKDGRTLRGYFKSIISGDSFALKYKIDRESDWATNTAESTAAAKESRFPLPTGDTRFNEVQVGVNIATTNTTSPEFYGMGFEYDDLKGERRV